MAPSSIIAQLSIVDKTGSECVVQEGGVQERERERSPARERER